MKIVDDTCEGTPIISVLSDKCRFDFNICCIRSAPAQQIFLKQDEAQLPYSDI